MVTETQQAPVETEKPESNESAPAKLQLDELTKLAAFIVGSFYVAGVLATNTYLYSLGITDFSLLKARYIYTGVLVLGLILLSVMAPAAGIHFFRYLPSMRVSESPASFSTAFMNYSASPFMGLIWLLGGLLLPFVIFFYFTNKGSPDLMEAVGLALWMFILTYGAGLFGMTILGLLFPEATGKHLMESIIPVKRNEATSTLPKPEKKHEPPNLIVGFIGSLIFLAYFAGYLSEFGNRILTKVPEQFGGAQPRRAQILFNADSVTGARELGINIPGEQGTLSEQLTVLYEGENIIAVRVSDEHVVQLSKDMIQAIKMNPSEK